MIMEQKTPRQLYEFIKSDKWHYEEEHHCLMLLKVLPEKWRISAFCAEAGIGSSTFYAWVNLHPMFKQCYELAQELSQEAWEKEGEDNKGNDDWDAKSWLQKGSRYFAKDKTKVKLEVNSEDTPWEQYQQILKQAQKGDFNASEIKQLMESVNVGTRVYESFKLQTELDTMKEDLNEMSQRHGNDTITTFKAQDSDKTSLQD